MNRLSHWRRKRRLRKMGVTVAFTDPNNPMRDWNPKPSLWRRLLAIIEGRG